ncbi:hypothetical protein DJ533_03095 [Acinetobacter defluvii]|uniref:DUF4377 domain-containing protein n=1 Tax=Acinetobacter defluvii TaxID=1871111 RepID=A0A2S2F9M2_9GAMM|nr:hypothetical protein [Acinetobacter defluvii]AWL27649.1 hypothetical protein DJ533_03095 [Acinetobacter defluvii]
MKKILLALGLCSLQYAHALPTTLTEEVYLKSFVCGGDSCYLSMDIAKVDNIQLSTFCGDRKYCSQYYSAYEKMMKNVAEDEYQEYELNGRKARVTLKLVDNPYSGQKIYETQSIVYLKD